MKIALIIILILILIILFFLYSIGAFVRVEFSEKEVGPYELIYEEHIGGYEQTGKVQDKIYYSLLNEEKIETFKGFGIYYDNPKEVEKAKLRSEVGSILEESDYGKIEDLKGKGYNIKTFEKKTAVVAELPYKNKMSIMVGVFKVYPKLEKYMDAKGYKNAPIMEIYDIPNKKIIYIAEILK